MALYKSGYAALIGVLMVYACPGHATSFDCEKAVATIEKLICQNQKLSLLDDEMASRYKVELTRSGNSASVRNDQVTWLRDRRNRCTDESCLVAAYNDRISALSKQSSGTKSPDSLTGPPEIVDLIRRSDRLNTKCRDGSEGHAQTLKYCEEREEVGNELKSRGWCHGLPSQPMNERNWQPCVDPLAQLMASIPMPHKPDWRKVEAANGAVFMVDMKSILRNSAGSVEVFVYAVRGSTYFPPNMKRYLFDCRGTYATTDELVNRYAPPNSVAGMISTMACGKAS